MVVLVDFDNIREREQNLGVEYVVESIIRSLDTKTLQNAKRILVRLYGGWYEAHSYTRKAQNIAHQIAGIYPKPYSIINDEVKKSLMVNVELAYSLVVLPETHLFNTYRVRGNFGGKIKCKKLEEIECVNPECPMHVVEAFFKERKCPHDECDKDINFFLLKAEQKLVDSMILTDLLHYTKLSESILVVVSSDDDLWPGIITAVISGVNVVHVYPHDPRDTYEYLYSDKPNYSIKRIWGATK